MSETRTRIAKHSGGWSATCSGCQWLYWSRSMRAAHTEASHHTCKPILGPRPLPPGATIEGGSSIPVSAYDPRADWWRSTPRLEAW